MKTITLITTLCFLLSFSSFAYNEEAMPSYEVVSQIEEKLPSFMGGDANAFSRWVNIHLKYPEIAEEYGLQGRVLIRFIVDTDGSVTDVKVLEGADPFLDKEAVRVVSSSPKWTPGTQNGKPLRVSYTFPVVFSSDFPSETLPKGAKKKNVDFKDKGYSISGYFLKNKPVENKIIRIYDAEGTIVLYGVYRIIDGKSAVHGRHDYESGGRIVSTYGIFYVSNGADKLIMKPRRASQLSVTDGQVDMWSGFYHDFGAELSRITDKSPLLYIFSNSDENGVWPYRSLSAEVSQSAVLSQDYKNIDVENLLLSDTLKVEIEWQDYTKFTGYALGKRGDTDYVYFTLLDGEKTDKRTGENTNVTKARFPDTDYKYKFVLKTPHSSTIEQILSLPASIENIDIDSLWSKSYYLAHSPEITIKYANGDIYYGSFLVSGGIYPVATTGTYTYKNGDKFIGDLSGAQYAGIHVDGKTIFNNGEEKEGNWLKEYALTDVQYLSVCKENHTPSDIRNAAQSLYDQNKADALVAKAKLYERNGNFQKAQELYLQSQSYKYSPSVDSKLKEIEDKVKRQKLVEKYGSRYADNILNEKIEIGMTKEMCELVLDKSVGMEFYRVSSWTDFGGNRIETWEYDFNYGVAQAKRELYDGTMEGLEEDGKEASLGEKAATALLSEAIMGFAKAVTSPVADTMTEYKYLKFKNSILVELNDKSNNQKKSENARSILDWLF